MINIQFIVGTLILSIHLSSWAQLGATPVAKFDPSIDPECGGLANAHGPFDYRKVNQDEKNLVENVHLNPQEKMLNTQEGRTNTYLWGEFDYTLRAFPNNPRALAGIDRLSEILHTDKPPRARYSAHCYFRRAVKFAPDDAIVRLMYGLYLVKRNKIEDAVTQLTEAENLAPNDKNVLYNLGLAYYKAKNYEKSRQYAQRAYQLGFPLPGLRNMLERIGKW